VGGLPLGWLDTGGGRKFCLGVLRVPQAKATVGAEAWGRRQQCSCASALCPHRIVARWELCCIFYMGKLRQAKIAVTRGGTADWQLADLDSEQGAGGSKSVQCKGT
jgi:hypothetical protein